MVAPVQPRATPTGNSAWSALDQFLQKGALVWPLSSVLLFSEEWEAEGPWLCLVAPLPWDKERDPAEDCSGRPVPWRTGHSWTVDRDQSSRTLAQKIENVFQMRTCSVRKRPLVRDACICDLIWHGPSHAGLYSHDFYLCHPNDSTYAWTSSSGENQNLYPKVLEIHAPRGPEPPTICSISALALRRPWFQHPILLPLDEQKSSSLRKQTQA